MNKKIHILLILTYLTISCQQSPLFIDYKNEHIEYSGRMKVTDTSGVEMYWSASSVKMNFKGRSVKALLKDQNGDNYFNVIIDDQEPLIIRPDTSKTFYTLAKDLEYGEHTVEIFKRNEWDKGITWFYGFELENDAVLLPTTREKKRKIEFYGNSITAGYAVEDTSGNDSPDSIFTNCYLSYASITARYFEADYNLIVKSGIGITISWFPQIMPDIYDLTNPLDPASTWDFSRFKPDLVIINLFQNDSWLVNMPENESFKATFGTQKPNSTYLINAYVEFVSAIRSKYPQTKILCMLGNMDITRDGSPWPGYVRQATARLNDPDIFTYFVPFKNTGGHPNITEQQEMADSLTTFIENRLEW